MSLTREQRRGLERVLADLTEIKASMYVNGVLTYNENDVLSEHSEEEGHIGKARCELAAALGRLTP